MQTLLNDPMVQTAIAPFLVALILGGALLRTRLAWFALVAAFATAVALGTGIGFTPLTASRKVLLLVLAAPFVGLVLDLAPRPPRASGAVLAALCGLAAVWVFWSVLSQQEPAQLLALAAGLAVFVGLMVGLTLRLRADGAAGAGAAVALGLSVGVASLLSASIGNFGYGIALAAGGGALWLLQFALQRLAAPGFVGMLTCGLAAGLFAAATFMLSQLPWFALPLLLAVPLAAGSGVATHRSTRVRMFATTLVPLAVSSAAVLAAWLATRTPAA
jgi:hypothetical protein